MDISEDEAALYDRQIRLWGLDAQKRLRNASLLVAGLNGLGAEIAKNLILAGVKFLTLLDHENVSTADTAQFLIDFDKDQGKNRAESSHTAAQALNPMVEVTVDTEDLASKDSAFFSKFTCICLTGNFSTSTLTRIDVICRENKVLFYCGHTWGLFGYGFVDLGPQHSFIEECTLLPPKDKKERNDAPKEVIKKHIFDYVTLSKTLAVRAGKANFGIDKKTSPKFFLLHVLLRFVEEQKRSPSSSSLEDDHLLLQQIRDKVQTDLGLADNALTDAHFQGLVFGEMSPVCAVVGGVLGQDIIKAVSAKDVPLRNVFLFDGVSCRGEVEHIGR